jgi:GNAT superfamily N-acetyltransferase
MLLPQAVHHGSGASAFIAADPAGLIIGAAAISPRLRALPMPGPKVAIHVIPPARGRGLGRDLSETCARIVLKYRAKVLYAWDMCEAGSPAIATWAKLGFDQAVSVQEGCMDVRRLFDYLKPLYDGILERGWIPRDARIVALHEADHRQIAALHAECLGGTIHDLLWVLRGDAPTQYDSALSPVIIVKEKVVAFSLLERTGPDSAFVHSTVVHPALRDGWANLWLKYYGASRCVDLGVQRVLHHSYDQHRDTRRLARATGATIRMLLEPYRILGEACSSAGG